MRNLSLQRGDAFILVYDVTKADTFEAVRRIRDDVHRVRQTTSVPIVVVGNKIDLADVETREVKCCRSLPVKYYQKYDQKQCYSIVCKCPIPFVTPTFRRRMYDSIIPDRTFVIFLLALFSLVSVMTAVK